MTNFVANMRNLILFAMIACMLAGHEARQAMICRFRLLLLSIFLLSFSESAVSQLQPVRNVPTPTVSTMGTLDNISVGHFTGTPNISIPLYEIEMGNYKLPIKANYNLAAVKPYIQPTVLGIGWNLMAGGYISRTVRGVHDEKKTSSGRSIGFFDHYSKIKNLTTQRCDSLVGRIVDSLYRYQAQPFELMTDEYSFNFCGYSGNFYLDENGKWIVVSDDDIKVEFDSGSGFVDLAHLSGIGRINRIQDWSGQNDNNRFFNKFTLYTPDGCKYDFGGDTATEYCCSYYHRANSDLIATTWFLTKITTPEGRTINFDYSWKNTSLSTGKTYDLICDLRYAPQERLMRYVAAGGGNGGYIVNQLWDIIIGHTGNETTSETDPPTGYRWMTGFLLFPTRLQAIRVDDLKIEFSYERNDYFAELFKGNFKFLFFTGSLLSELYTPNCQLPGSQYELFMDGVDFLTHTSEYGRASKIGERLQWSILSQMKVISSSDTSTIKFSYTGTDASSPKRHKLTQIEFRGDGSVSPMTYRFEYNSARFPSTCYPLVNTDAWGYYGRLSSSGLYSLSDNPTFTYPAPSLTDTQAETLARIIYPTKGSTSFYYELNTFSKYVSDDHQSVIDSAGYAGGLRLSRYVNRDVNGQQLNGKRFYYSFNRGLNAPNQSSGVLNHRPQNTVDYYYNDEYERELHVKSLNGFYVNPVNDATPAVGYSCVFEESFDRNGIPQGFVKYEYSNYGIGDGYLDMPAVHVNMDGQSPYFPFSSTSFERGKLLSESVYSNSGALLKKVDNTYQSYHDNTHVMPHHVEFYFTVNGETWPVTCAAWLTSTHMARSLVTTQVTNYYYEAKDYHETTTTNYNQYLLPSVVMSYESAGKRTEHHYHYACDTEDYRWMKDRHLLTPRKTIQTFVKNQELTTVATITEQNTFASNSEGVPYCLENTLLYGTGQQGKVNYTVNSTDKYGNPTEIVQDGVSTVLVWAQKGVCLVARIENATASEIAIDPSAFSDNNLSGVSYEDFDDIRMSFPNCHVYTFKYDGLHRLTAETAPNGLTTYYAYDGMGRLSETYLLNPNKQTIRRYDYQYYTNY